MTNPEPTTRTALLLVIDRSGSMQGIRDDMVGGLQRMLADQAAQPGIATVDIVVFDTEIELQCSMVDIAEARIRLEPRGSTALYDALGSSIEGFASTLDSLPAAARPDIVQVIVVTDGHENSSRRFTAQQVRALVESHQRERDWEFVFLGANQDAVLTGTRLGFDAGSSMTFAAKGEQVDSMADSLSRYVTDVRASKKQLFFEEERRRAEEALEQAENDRDTNRDNNRNTDGGAR